MGGQTSSKDKCVRPRTQETSCEEFVTVNLWDQGTRETNSEEFVTSEMSMDGMWVVSTPLLNIPDGYLEGTCNAVA